MAEQSISPPPRLASLDAYRGFIMLAMASGGFAFARVVESPFRLVAFFCLGEDQVLIGGVQLDALNIIHAEARQQRIAQVAERDRHVG